MSVAAQDQPQLTPEQATRVRLLGLLFAPFRIALALLALSLFGGLPVALYSSTHGLVLAALVAFKDLAEYLARVPTTSGRLRDRDAVFVWLAVQAPLIVSVLDRTYLPEILPRTLPLLATGAAVAVAGILFRAWSVRTLGVFFTLAVRIHDDHQLIEAGPYARVRHPAYTGALTYLLGVCLALSSVAGLVVWALVAVPGVLWRIRSEELALRRRLGDPYRDYIKRTKRLVPGLY